MKIITMIPYFRENDTITSECLNNISIYSDGAVICVNDYYDKRVEGFLKSFDIVKQVTFINKDKFSDAILNSSLLTMAQNIGADWVIKQDIDEEFEHRIHYIRTILESTRFDQFTVLWPSFVKDINHCCYYQHSYATGALKAVIFRLDLNKIYVPSGMHTNVAMRGPNATLDLRLFHKNLLKSDQENYIKFILSERKAAGDGCVIELEKDLPFVLKMGEDLNKLSFLKREADHVRLGPYCFKIDTIFPEIPITIYENFRSLDFNNIIKYLHGEQNG